MKRPAFVYVLVLLHILLGLAAFAGGGMLILKPDGSWLGMENGWLRHSPFDTYFLPGLILFTLNGLLPLFTFIGLLSEARWHWANAVNIYSNRRWAWTYSLYIGIISIAWIAIQQIITEFFWIQPVVIIMGLLIIVFTMLPKVMNYYETK